MPLGFLYQFLDAFRRFGALDAGFVADLLKTAVGEAGHSTPASIEVAPDGELECVERDVLERRHTGVLDFFSEPEGSEEVV